MEFGPRPKDRPGSGKVPTFAPGMGAITAREHRKIGKSSAWFSDYESLSVPELEEKYPSGLLFYDEPPRCQINLETMERLAVERLRFLRLVEKMNSIHGGKIWTSDYEMSLKAEAKNQHLMEFINVLDGSTMKDRVEVLRNRAKDHFSHFILRLAYCRTDELRRWFVSHEADALRFKMNMATPQEINIFMQLHNLRYTEVSEEEKSKLSSQLSAAANTNINSTTYYKVHFTEALELIRTRRIFLSGGIAYVPESEMKTLLISVFKNLLAHNLALTAKTLPNLDEDERLIKMLADLDRRYTGDDYSVNNNMAEVTADMVRPLSSKHFPMCMKSMQMALDSSHHLKYKARLQYGLFLKGIGLTMEEAIRYFRGEFTQSHVNSEKFDKEYVYGIRYNYGKEGKKVNWAPWSCMRIIMENVGPGENHGCPYRHADPDALRSMLAKAGVEGENLEEIVKISREGHFQKACAVHFRASNKGQEISSTMVEHPNQFYLESSKGGAIINSSRPTLKTEKAVLYQEGKKGSI